MNSYYGPVLSILSAGTIVVDCPAHLNSTLPSWPKNTSMGWMIKHGSGRWLDGSAHFSTSQLRHFTYALIPGPYFRALPNNTGINLEVGRWHGDADNPWISNMCTLRSYLGNNCVVYGVLRYRCIEFHWSSRLHSLLPCLARLGLFQQSTLEPSAYRL